MNDLISIIVPVYNVEKYLRRCIDSIIGQTYKNLEIILIDDGSTDGSPEICDEYGMLDSRVVVIHKPNGGLSDARNTGIDISKGDYLGFVDSDDYIKEDMYEYLYSNLKNYSADISVCGVIDEAEYGEFTGMPTNFYYVDKDTVYDGEKATELLIEDRTIVSHAWDKLYSRRVFDNIRYPFGKRFEDMYIAHLLMNNAEKVVLLPESKYYYVRREDSISFTKQRLNEQHIFEAYLQRFDFAKSKGESLANLALSKATIMGINIYNHSVKGGQYEVGTVEKVLEFLQHNLLNINKNNLIGKKFKIMAQLIVHVRPLYYVLYGIYSGIKR